MTPASPTLILIKCFLRTYLVGAAFNTRGMQNIGLAFIMQPWLNHLYPDPNQCRAATKRYLRHYQCHMLFTPIVAALCMSMESYLMEKKISPQALEEMKSTTSYTLSALGDSLYCSGLTVLWALVCCGFIFTGAYTAAAIWTAFCFASLQLFKIISFYMAYRTGVQFIRTLKRWNLINAVSWLKIVNAILIPVLAALALFKIDNHTTWDIYIGSVAVILFFGWFIWRTHFARGILIIFLVLLLWLRIFL